MNRSRCREILSVEYGKTKCMRCGNADPKHFYLNDMEDIIACDTCPDVHVFEGYTCRYCGADAFADGTTPFCPRRAQ